MSVEQTPTSDHREHFEAAIKQFSSIEAQLLLIENTDGYNDSSINSVSVLDELPTETEVLQTRFAELMELKQILWGEIGEHLAGMIIDATDKHKSVIYPFLKTDYPGIDMEDKAEFLEIAFEHVRNQQSNPSEVGNSVVDRLKTKQTQTLLDSIAPEQRDTYKNN